MQFLDQTMMKV